MDANGNITIDDREDIEHFVRFLNSNQGATYKDVASEVFSAGRGYSNELDEVVVTGSKSAYDNGSWLGSAQSRQASGAALISWAFALGELSGGLTWSAYLGKCTICNRYWCCLCGFDVRRI